MVDAARDPRNDEDLFALVRSSDDPASARAALAVLFTRYHARVLLSCERILGDATAAEDATQEIFLALLEARRRYESRHRFGAWLFVLTRNHCLNRLRGKRREVDADPFVAFLNEADDAPDPGQIVELDETAQRVRRACLEELSTIERRVVELRLEWELPVKEIDRMLGLENRSGARTHLSTARRKLRAALADLAPHPSREGERE